ncbi:MAG: mechanosensitive ion channel family protein, partial [Ramlibacter sp.]|nr:mechanosensitive ion channel family protein [Ramlibacter sp.]
MDTEAIWAFLATQGVDFGLKVLGAIIVWLIGRWLIGWARRLAKAALQRGRHIDETLARYLSSALAVALNVLLILAVLDIFGVKTTSFAALLAGVGLAVGTAWGGLLTHFAAGVFLQVLRPYKVGDHVIIGGANGRVTELGLFGTTLVTGDSVTVLVGNNKVLSDNIQNLSSQPARRVDTTAKIANGVDVHEAITKLQEALAKIPNVAKEPKPEVQILQFTPEGPLLAVRPYT